MPQDALMRASKAPSSAVSCGFRPAAGSSSSSSEGSVASARQLHAPLQAVGQAAGRRVGQMRQAHHGDQFTGAHPRQPFLLARAGQASSETQKPFVMRLWRPSSTLSSTDSSPNRRRF